MPPQNRVWRDDRRQVQQGLAAKGLSLYCQPPSLIITEQDPFLAELFQQHLNLGPLKLNHFLLVPVDPAGQDGDEQLPGLKDAVHDSPDVDLEGASPGGCGLASSSHVLHVHAMPPVRRPPLDSRDRE